jgi:hypothetical protein
MQQRQKSQATPSKTTQPTNQVKGARPAPLVLDEKTLRQIGGGLSAPHSPNGGW